MNNLSQVLEAQQLHKNSGEAYLKVQLEPQTQAVLLMKQIQEVLFVPVEGITSIPNMPNFVIGLLNQRNRVFWVIDLPQLLQLSPLDTDVQEYNIVIVQIDNIPMGLVVQKVQGVMRWTEDIIQAPIGKVDSAITPYLKGCIWQPQEGILLVLDAQSILEEGKRIQNYEL